jgi:hypothetical protein
MSKIRASFIISSENMLYKDIDNVIWINADRKWNKWDKMIVWTEWNGLYHRNTSWILEANIKSLSIEDYILFFLEKLNWIDEQISKISENSWNEVKIYITIEEKKDFSWFFLDKSLLKKVVSLGASISVDFFI